MSTDALARRLRFAPPDPGPDDNIIPQVEDHDGWEAILYHGPLPISYVARFDPRINYQHLQRRYTRFYHNGWVVRPARQYASFHARYSPLVYDLTPKAKAALGSRYPALPASRTAPFVHQLMQACVTASLEIEAPKRGLRFVRRDELLKGKSLDIQLAGYKLIPDDVFALAREDGKMRRYFLEIDRNTESIERTTNSYNTWAKKVQAYDALFSGEYHKSHYGFPVATVLIVTTNPTHARNLANYIGQKSSCPDRYIFSVEETFGANWRTPKALLSTIDDIV